MNVGSIVRIDDDNEWNGLYGIVKYSFPEVDYIFCVQKPYYLYRANNNNKIIIVNSI